MPGPRCALKKLAFVCQSQPASCRLFVSSGTELRGGQTDATMMVLLCPLILTKTVDDPPFLSRA